MNPSQPEKQQRTALFLILAGGILLILAALALIFQNTGSEPGAGLIDEDLPYPEVARISVDDAKSRIDSGAAIVLDVRSVANFEAAHIAGSISMPAADVQLRMGELPRDQQILTYCT